MPLRVEADVAAGRAGGEGFQVVESIVYAPSDPRVVYLSTNTSQVWRSDDGGTNWRSARRGIRSHGVVSLAVQPEDADIVVAAASYGARRERVGRYPDRHEGVYVTVDGGGDWRLVREARFTSSPVKGTLLAFVRSGEGFSLLAGSEDELLRSDDLGATWHLLTESLGTVSDIAVCEGGSAYIAAESGLHRYRNGEVMPAGRALNQPVLAVAADHHSCSRLWVVTRDEGVFRSVDAGRTFTPMGGKGIVVLENSPVDAQRLFGKRHFSKRRMPVYSRDGGIKWSDSRLRLALDPRFDTTNQHFWFSAPFGPHPTDPSIVLTVSNGKGRILRSNDGGQSWTYSGTGFTGGRAEDIAFDDRGGLIVCVSDHGLWAAADAAGPYRHVVTPQYSRARSCGAVAVENDHIVAAVGTWKNQMLISSANAGRRWRKDEQTVQSHRFAVFDPRRPGSVYAGSYVSRDYGRHWSPGQADVRAMSVRGTLYGLVGQGRTSSLVASDDGARTWTPATAKLPALNRINDLAVATRGSSERVFLATTRGLVIAEQGNWKILSEEFVDGFGESYIDSVAVDPNDQSRVYLGKRAPGSGQSNGVFASSDGGEIWSNITYNLGPDMSIWSINVSPVDSSVYIGTSLGTFRLRR